MILNMLEEVYSQYRLVKKCFLGGVLTYLQYFPNVKKRLCFSVPKRKYKSLKNCSLWRT